MVRITIACLVLAGAGLLAAQDTNDRELLRALSQQVNELQAKIRELESRMERAAAPEVAKAQPVVNIERTNAPRDASTVPTPEFDPNSQGGTQTGPRLAVRGYADLGYRQSGRTPESPSGFGVGQVDLFVTSKITNRVGLLMETVLESKNGQELAIDLERFLFQYRQNRYLNVDVGRYHSNVGYYNTAYHHGTWFQTAASRPQLFAFEDNGGLLPIHNVGVSLSGALPGRAADALNLRYAVEIGNGRDYQSDIVQTAQDRDRSKSVNISLGAKPLRAPGLDVGTSFYRDRLRLNGKVIEQNILAAYAVYSQHRIESLTEFIAMRHAPVGTGGGATYAPSFYTQLSYRVAGPWRPYFRYEYANPSPRDPIIQRMVSDGVFRGSVVGGIRYDFAEFAALKFETQRVMRRNQASEFRAAVNVAFTF